MKQKPKCFLSESIRREARIFPELSGTEVGKARLAQKSCESWGRAGKKGTAVQHSVKFNKFLIGRLQFCLKVSSKAYLEETMLVYFCKKKLILAWLSWKTVVFAMWP